MYKEIILKAISVIAAAAIIYIAAGSPDGRDLPAEMLYQELDSYRNSLKGTVAKLRDELDVKKNELAKLDQELVELETQYNRLLADSRRIAERLEYLKGAQ